MKLLLIFVLVVESIAALQISLTKVKSLRTSLREKGILTPYHQNSKLERRGVKGLCDDSYSASKRHARSSTSQGLNVFNDLEYVANITIGTPGQLFTMLMDTGSANLYIADLSCKHCPSQHKFDSSLSSTYNKTNLGEDHCDIVGLDTVTLIGTGSNLSIPNSYHEAFVVDFPYDSYPSDGVFGMAFQPLAVQNTTPPLINAINQNLFDNPWFTVYLKASGYEHNVPGGAITYGVFDSINCSPIIEWQPLTSATTFQFALSGVAFGNFSQTKTWQTISDTGTAFIVAPYEITDAIASIAGAYLNQTDGLYYIDCNANTPPLQLTIGNHIYNVSSENLIVPADATKCYWAFMRGEDVTVGNSWVLGSPFIRQFCNTYDLGNKRIGFALPHSFTPSTTPSKNTLCRNELAYCLQFFVIFYSFLLA